MTDAFKKPETIIAAGAALVAVGDLGYTYVQLQKIRDAVELQQTLINNIGLGADEHNKSLSSKIQQLNSNNLALRDDVEQLVGALEQSETNIEALANEINNINFRLNSVVEILRKEGKTIQDPPPRTTVLTAPRSISRVDRLDDSKSHKKDKKKDKKKPKAKPPPPPESDDSSSSSSSSDDSDSDPPPPVARPKADKSPKPARRRQRSRQNDVDAILNG